MNTKGSSIAQAAIGMTVVIFCAVSLWRDLHLSPHDIVRRTGGRGAWMERWQAEAIYMVGSVAGTVLLVDAIRKFKAE